MRHQVEEVHFPHADLDVVGDLHLPGAERPVTGFPAVVIATPGSSVRGQIGANYGSRLAAAGFASLAFDPAHQGQSAGQPRDLEDPQTRAEDVRCAVDHLFTRPDIDTGRIGLLGVCAGGGYAIEAAKTDHRIRAVATVVAVNIGRAMRQGAPTDPGAVAALLAAVGEERTRVAQGGAAQRDPWLPDTPEQAEQAGITDPDVLEAVDFYRTPRGLDPYSTNRRLATSTAALLGFDAFHLVEQLLTQPLQVIVGSRRASTGSYEDSLQLWERAPASEPVVVIPGAGHYDLYDDPDHVSAAVAALSAFYSKCL